MARPSSGGAGEGRLGVGDSGEGDGRGWSGSSWGARGGGEEALGQWNRGEVVRLGRVPAEAVRRRFGVSGHREDERGEITERKSSAWSHGASTIPRKEGRGRGRGGESGHGYGRKTVSGAGEPPWSRGGRSAPVG
jgi:hypothetical protein